jgi:site-specific recombinase XerC
MTTSLAPFIKRFLSHYLPVQKGLAANTIVAYRVTLKLLLQAQTIRAIPLKRTDYKVLSYLEEKEMQALLDAVDVNSRTGLRDKALLLLLYNTGARVSEVVGLNMEDLRLDGSPQVKLMGKGRRERSCPLWPESPWERLEAQVVLGSAAFIARVRAMAHGNRLEQPSFRRLQPRPGWEQVVKAVEVVKGQGWHEFRDRYGDWRRDLAMHVARQDCGIGLKELSELVGGLEYISVATALRRFRGRLVANRTLRDACEQVSRC